MAFLGLENTVGEVSDSYFLLYFRSPLEQPSFLLILAGEFLSAFTKLDAFYALTAGGDVFSVLSEGGDVFSVLSGGGDGFYCSFFTLN